MLATKKIIFLFFISFSLLGCFRQKRTATIPINKGEQNLWPQATKFMHPWTRWWWMGSAVDEKNIDQLMNKYHEVAFGGVEVTPIYGAVGYEKRYINFLSPQWMDVLRFTVQKADALGMGVDMNTGTGWPFGGPHITPELAASKLVVQTYTLKAGQTLTEKLVVNDARQATAGATLQALTAYSDGGEAVSLLDKVDKEGKLKWSPASGVWTLYAAFNGKTLQMVKRAAPGGEGLVLDHLSKNAVDTYLHPFDEAFRANPPGIRAFFNDSYEVYFADWSPRLFEEFQQRRGYDLRLYLNALLSKDSSDIVARVKSDYRETMSDMLLNNFTTNWTNWAHSYNKVTKNQAHGSPGNLLDLYGAVDIPECETFFGTSYFPIPGLRRDSGDVMNANPDPIMFKFATSAAHVYGKPLASSETFVWLTEHFKTSLSQCKPEVEQLFLSGVNHTFYHGTTYSPDDVSFPGWLFYASVNFVPSNSWWPHVKGLNEYITRCQSLLQAGKPDNELLIYWPVYDAWNSAQGMDMPLTTHNVHLWLHPTPFYKLATQLQKSGYTSDFVSDKMIGKAQVNGHLIETATNAPTHQVLVVPECRFLPVETLEKIMELANKGATVIFQQLPQDVPGLKSVEERKNNFKNLLSRLHFTDGGNGVMQYNTGSGQIVLANDVQKALAWAGVHREELTDTGIECIRRNLGDGKYYYLVNHTAKTIDTYLPLNVSAKGVAIMDPLHGNYGLAATQAAGNATKVRVQLQPGEALFLRSFDASVPAISNWKYIENKEHPIGIGGAWSLHFTQGGPALPTDRKLQELVSWTKLPDANAEAFSGMGEYTIDFTLPSKNAGEYILDLGKVFESAHVWINDKDAGIWWSYPFQARVGAFLKKGKNTLRIEVANLMANRIRDMDKKGIKWRNYHEINFVNIKYQPFDASNWQPMTSGLLGPVTLTPVR